jgi:predicted DCC family thiol-disulfide oxidoreductase YuxK
VRLQRLKDRFTSSWRGGEYSMLRFALGATAFVRLVPLLVDAPSALGRPTFLHGPFAIVVAVLLLTAAVALALGIYARSAALILGFGLLLFVTPGFPWTSFRWMPSLGLLVLVQELVPGAPYLSVAARNRLDPDGGWRMPQSATLAVWAVLGLAVAGALLGFAIPDAWRGWWGHAFSRGSWNGIASAVLAAGIVVAAGSPKARPVIWAAAGAMIVVAALARSPGLDLAGALLTLVAAFDPGWIRGERAGAPPDLVFYDGSCGLCHRAVRFVLAEDRAGTEFRFAPLDSDAFRAHVPEAVRATLPDSIILWRADGRLVTESTSVAAMLRRLGGFWRIAGILLAAVPRRIRDAAYRAIARVRRRLFPPPPAACPLLPPRLAPRFEVGAPDEPLRAASR